MNALDREVIELLHERPDLLAVADAVATTQERRRLPRVALAPALAVAAAVALLLVAPWQGHGPSFVDRALAAVGNGPVIHAVVAFSGPNDVVVNLATGDERERTHRNEFWWDGELGALRTRNSTDGGAPTDFATRDPLFAHVDPADGGFAMDYRDALERGDARVVGDAQVDGRPAKRIEFGPNRGGGTQEVTVDAETFAPLVIQTTYPNGRRTPPVHVVAIESLPYRESDFTPIKSERVWSSSGRVTEGRDVTLDEATRALGKVPLGLGRAPDSVQLSHVSATLTDGSKLGGILVRLSYGDVRVSVASDRAGSFALGFGESEFPTPPQGSIAVTGNDADGWQGDLRQEDFAVMISAPTKARVVAAARALTPQR
jgi:hypothetical protein